MKVDPNCDPFGDDNKLILAAGPLTGTIAPTGARYMVLAKSPLTGALTSSNSGGYFQTELKRAGYDAIIIEGKASDPVYIRIKDRDRAAGRSGVGAVLGSKNLKGIVVRGTGDIQLTDENMFKEVNNKYRSRFKEATRNNQSPLRLHGTAITAVATQANGVFPTKNFQYGTFDGWESIYGETLTKKYLVRPKACFSCPIACGRLTKVPDGPFKGEGPEYEMIYSLGSDCGVDNLAALTKANYLCNELGL